VVGGVTPTTPGRRFPVGSCLWFGCDYLRLAFGDGYKSGLIDRLFDGLSENSNIKQNQIFFGLEGFQLTALFFADKKVGILSWNNTSIMEFSISLKAGARSNCNLLISYYSAIFHIPELKEFIIRSLNIWKENGRVSRCDLAADIVCPVSDFFKDVFYWKKVIDEDGNNILDEEGKIQWEIALFNTQFKKYYIIGKETFYLGSKAKNHNHFIRVYDKKLDSNKKGKFGIFGHYIKMKQPVTRCEVEMHYESCKDYKITVLDILEWLHENKKHALRTRIFQVLLSTCGNARGTLFSRIANLQKRNVILMQSRKNRPAQLDDDLIRIKYAKTMFGFAKNLRTAGYDPVKFLTKQFRMLSQLENNRQVLHEIEAPSSPDSPVST